MNLLSGISKALAGGSGIGALAGGALGLLGGGSDKQSATSAPILSAGQKKGFDYLEQEALKLAQKPYEGPPTMRYEAPKGFGGMFASPIIAQRQALSDAAFQSSQNQPAPTAHAAPAASAPGNLALVQQFLAGNPAVSGKYGTKYLFDPNKDQAAIDAVTKFAMMSPTDQWKAQRGGSQDYMDMIGLLQGVRRAG